MAIRLEVHICEQRRSYVAEFATEDQALEFIARKMRTHAFYELEDSEIKAEHKRLIDFLFPTCVHGMSESLCEGPMHYSDGMYV
jgi:hypothetical protein